MSRGPFFFFFFWLVTFKNHWNLFWVIQNGKIFYWEKCISHQEKKNQEKWLCPLRLRKKFLLRPCQNFWKKKNWDFCTIRMVGISNDCMLKILTYLLLSSKKSYKYSSIFYFSKLTSVNAHYIGLWDTLEMMLFIKDHIKWKHIGRISWKVSSLINFKVLYGIWYKKTDAKLVQWHSLIKVFSLLYIEYLCVYVK